jgi:hypothetical protein
MGLFVGCSIVSWFMLVSLEELFAHAAKENKMKKHNNSEVILFFI